MIAEFYRFMFDYSDLKGLDAGIRGTAPDVAWIVDVAGPDGGPVWRGAWALTLYLRRGSKHRAIAWRLATAGDHDALDWGLHSGCLMKRIVNFQIRHLIKIPLVPGNERCIQ